MRQNIKIASFFFEKKKEKKGGLAWPENLSEGAAGYL